MKKTNKFIALTLGAAMACSAMSPMVSSAEGGPDFILLPGYNIDAISLRILENDTYANTVYIDPADLKNGDYTFQAGIYLEGDYEMFGDTWHFHSLWQGYDEEGVESKYIQSKNVVTYGYQWNDEKNNMFIDATTLDPNTATMDDVFAESPYKVRVIDEKTGEEEIRDVDYDERTGTGTVVVNKTANEHNSTMGLREIRHYDPNTPKGGTFGAEAAFADIHCYSDVKNAWINKITGDNKMVQFNVEIDENTPNGTYYIGFIDPKSEDNNSMSGNGKYLYASNCHYVVDPFNRVAYNNDQSYWLKIVVGDQNEESESYTIEHATAILTTYAENAVRSSTDMPLLKSTYMGDDINGDGVVDLSDATAVLEQYAKNAAKLN